MKKIIKNSKDIATLEVGDVVVFGDLEYIVTQGLCCKRYYLDLGTNDNAKIFEVLNIDKVDFIKKLGIEATYLCFPEVKSLEALTAIVSALFKEYEKQKELPKTWEEFCARNSVNEEEAFISSDCNVFTVGNCSRKSRCSNIDRNLCTSSKEAEAFLALMQLRQLRKAYVKDWEPDWNDTKQYKANIIYSNTDFIIVYFKDLCSRPLSFPTCELAKQFLNNFKDLLEVAKPLL